MADVDVKVEMHLDHVEAVLKDVTDGVLKQFAYRVTERAQLNIRENNQIDTGFMVNSIYPIWKDGGSEYEAAVANASTQTLSVKTGRTVDHRDDFAPEPPLEGNAAAAVVVGANYAIYQEALNPFLYPAAEAAAREFGVEAERIYKQELPDEGPK